MSEILSFTPPESAEVEVAALRPLEFRLPNISIPMKISNYFSQHSGERVGKERICTEIFGYPSYIPKIDDRNILTQISNARKLMKNHDPLSEIYPINNTGFYIHFARLAPGTTIQIPQLFIDDHTIESLNYDVQPLAVTYNEVTVNRKNLLISRFSHQEMSMLMKLMMIYPQSIKMNEIISEGSCDHFESIPTIIRENYLRLQKKLADTPYHIERDFVRGRTRTPTRFQLTYKA